MPHVWEPAPVFHRLVRNGKKLTVHHVFKNDDAGGVLREYRFGLTEAVGDDSEARPGGIGGEGVFDVRDLPPCENPPSAQARDTAHAPDRRKAAIDAAAEAGWFDGWIAENADGLPDVADDDGDLTGIGNLVGPAGKVAVGTVECLYGTARFLAVEGGDTAASYEGTTDVHWDAGGTARGPRGGEMLTDRDGNEWEAGHVDPGPYRPSADVRHLAAILERGGALCASLRDFLRMFPDDEGPAIDLARRRLAAFEEIVGGREPTPTAVPREVCRETGRDAEKYVPDDSDEETPGASIAAV